MNTNKYGLKRHIPEKSKLEIRQRDGFGCIMCGLAITEYAHIEPAFKNSKKHNLNNIALLCPICHKKFDRGFIPIKYLKEAMKSPKCKQQGYSREILYYSNNSKIILLNNEFLLTQIPLQVNNKPIIYINPRKNCEPNKLNTIFFDSSGKQTLRIINNEWFASTNNWDMRCEGGKVIIQSSPTEINLILDFKTSLNNIIIEELFMNVFGNIIQSNKNFLMINKNNFANNKVSGHKIGFQIGKSLTCNDNIGMHI